MKNIEMENKIPTRRNIWNLVLGLIFVIYGSYRLYVLSNSVEGSTFSYVLAVLFVVLGLYDLWKYYNNTRTK